jgi:hypothetical protein
MSVAGALDDGGSASAHGAVTPLTRSTYRLVEALFDLPFYLETYPDVQDSGVDPIAHYLETGWKEHRDPSPTFSTTDYLRANRDVAASGVCPLVHYVTAGVLEGRAPHAGQRAQGRLPRRRGSPARNAINSAVPLAEQAKSWLLPSPVQPVEGSVLARAIDGLAARPSAGIVVSLSHDDYAIVAGGVETCVSDEERALRGKGWAYLHFCPVQPLPSLAEPVPADKFLVWVRLNGERVGAVSLNDLAAELGRGRFGGRRRLMVLHHLLGSCPELIAEVARAFGPHETIAWVHDFFTLCPSYALMRNNVAFCGAPESDSQACGICVYGGAERKRHLERMGRLFDELRPTVLAPSETALKFWLGHGHLAHQKTKAMPHGTLAMGTAMLPAANPGQPHLRVGFVGYPSYHKGWHVFERLAIRHEEDPRYSFFHFASAPAAEFSNVIYVEVVMDRARRDFMVEAVAAHAIDVVVNWSLCYETFSFTAHESVAGGAFVLAPTWAGNIVPAISQEGIEQGLGLETEQELFDLFASGDVFDVVKRRRHGKFVPLAGTAAYLEIAG